MIPETYHLRKQSDAERALFAQALFELIVCLILHNENLMVGIQTVTHACLRGEKNASGGVLCSLWARPLSLDPRHEGLSTPSK
jgi:hypothetical protein